MNPKREPVQFVTGEPQCVALESTAGQPVDYGKVRYWLTDHRIMFVPHECSVKIGMLDPQPKEKFWILRRHHQQGRKSTMVWEVTSQNPAPALQQLSGVNRAPGNPQAAADATGIPETQLEQQLRRSIEEKQVRQAAANRIRAKLNLEQSGQAIPPVAPPVVERKPPQAETGTPVLGNGTTGPAPQSLPNPSWMPPLVEVARSFVFKLSLGNYQTCDFFCSQKAECRPEDAEIVSERLYEFCRRQVMRSVDEFGSERKRA